MKLQINGQAAYIYTGSKPLDPQLTAIVLVHGALHDHSVWIQQSRYLAHHGFAVLAVDLPGHGRSAGSPLSVIDAGRWVAEVVRACGVQQVVLAGHSMGSLMALEAAAHLGEQARHLVMVGTAYPMAVSAQLLDLSQRDPLKAIELVNSLSISSIANKPSSPGPGFWVHFKACNDYAGLEAAAAALRCPTSLVLGERDQMTSPKATAPLVAVLKPTIHQLQAGHNLMAEAPDGVLNILHHILRSTLKDTLS
jgi:pimeloyl-ACP methyl ester carboxylesterase